MSAFVTKFPTGTAQLSQFMETGDASYLTGKPPGPITSDTGPTSGNTTPEGLGIQQSTSFLATLRSSFQTVFGLDSAPSQYNRSPTESDDFGGLDKRATNVDRVLKIGPWLVYLGIAVVVGFAILAWRRR